MNLGALLFTSSSFVDNYSLNFPTSSDYLSFGNNLGFTSSTPFSMNIWFYLTAFPGAGQQASLFNKGVPPDKGVGFYINSDQSLNLELVNIQFTDHLFVKTAAGAVTQLNSWHCASWSYDGSKSASGVTMVLDTFQQSLTTVDNTLTGDFSNSGNAYVSFDVNDIGGQSGITGSVLEMSVFNGTQLSGAQLIALASTGKPTNLINMAGLTNWFRLQDTYTDSVPSSSVSGTPIGSPVFQFNVPSQFLWQVFPNTYVPNGPLNQAGPYSMGIKFSSLEPGYVHAVRFYKGTSFSETSRQARLYTLSGTLLQTYSFSGESASGWQTSAPNGYAIAASTTYVLMVDFPSFWNQASSGIPATTAFLTISNSVYATGTGNFYTGTAPGSFNDGIVDLVFSVTP
jgi:hypothetical protein